MYINHKHKFIFIHIPKTGGTSILCALLNLLNGPGSRKKGYPGLDEPGWHGWQLKHHKPGKMHKRLCDLYISDLSDYKPFTVIRHPLDRFASLFNVYGHQWGCESMGEFIRDDRIRTVPTYHGFLSHVAPGRSHAPAGSFFMGL